VARPVTYSALAVRCHQEGGVCYEGEGITYQSMVPLQAPGYILTGVEGHAHDATVDSCCWAVVGLDQRLDRHCK
jgi:hypothetical protein